MTYVSALFVRTGGAYYGINGVDTWDEKRDARLYEGPFPVIAHPPCQRWGSLAASNYARWGGEHNRPGNDGGCFKSALESVRKWGGVLEHPALTRAFRTYGLPRPVFGHWQKTECGGWVTEVWQSAYGHRANKATWMYCVGGREDYRPPDLKWEKVVGTHQVGYADKRGKERNKPTLSRKEAIDTPKEFKEVLLRIAMEIYNDRHSKP